MEKTKEIVKSKTLHRKNKHYALIMHNDQTTYLEVVLVTLMNCFKFNEKAAVSIADEIQRVGKLKIKTYGSRDRALMEAENAKDFALALTKKIEKKRNCELKITVEEEDE